MVRAATLGMLDFSEFDPYAPNWWLKLRWVLDELERQTTVQMLTVQQNHWGFMVAHGNLTDESFDDVKTNASTAVNKILKKLYPWLADLVGEQGAETERQQLVDAYHEYYGYPGEERYEKMIVELRKALRHKLSPMEKRRYRQQRHLRWQRQQQEQQ